jgi:hypothetical protein
VSRGYGAKVEVLSAPLVARLYGRQERDWAAAQSTSYAAWVGASSTSEELGTSSDGVDQTDAVESRLSVHLEAGAAVTSEDRVRWSGDDYEVMGDPKPALRNGVPHHVELSVRKLVRWWFAEEVQVRRYAGEGAYGPVFDTAVSVRADVDTTGRLVRVGSGDEVQADFTLRMPAEAVDTVRVESEVVVRSRPTRVLTVTPVTERGGLVYLEVTTR